MDETTNTADGIYYHKNEGQLFGLLPKVQKFTQR